MRCNVHNEPRGNTRDTRFHLALFVLCIFAFSSGCLRRHKGQDVTRIDAEIRLSINNSTLISDAFGRAKIRLTAFS